MSISKPHSKYIQNHGGGRDLKLAGWHHQLNGREFEQTSGDSEGQGSLACCSQGVTKSQTRLNN